MAGQPTRSVWIDEAFLPCLSLCLAMLWSHLSKRSWNFVFSPSRQIINQQLICPISLQYSVLKEFLLGRLDNELGCGGCSSGCLLGKWFKGSGFESPKRNLIYFLFFSPIQLKRKLKRRNSNIIMIFLLHTSFLYVPSTRGGSSGRAMGCRSERPRLQSRCKLDNETLTCS